MSNLLKLHHGPQKVMRKRDKRLLDYLRLKSIKERGDKPDKKTVEQGEQFVALNDALKDELPKLYALTGKLVQACLAKFVQLQANWLDSQRAKLEYMMTSVPVGDVRNIVEEFSIGFTNAEAQVLNLGICNGSILADFMHNVRFNSQISLSSGRQSSTTTSARGGAASIDESVASSQNNKSTYFLPGAADRRAFKSRGRADSAISTRHSPESGREYQQQQQQQQQRRRWPSSNSSDTSGVEMFPRLPSLDLDTPILDEVLSAAERTPIMSNPSPNKVLFLAASIYQFNIDRARRESGYPYLTYVAGEIFDVIAEVGELWLARNQDDSSGQLGWIWNKHFAKLVG